MWAKTWICAVIALVTGLSATPVRADSETCWDHRDDEIAIAELGNEARRYRGLGALRLDPELSRVARHHAREMASRGELEHTDEGVLGRRVTNWKVLTENIGSGSSPEMVHETFMDSATHRRNLLGSELTYVGVGVVRTDGSLWVTVVYEGRSDPGTRLEMPSC